MKCLEVFELTYKRTPENVAFCPYRVCPIGAHSDHQLGKVTGLALDKGIHIAYAAKRSGVVDLISLQFPQRVQWHVGAVPAIKENDWADYLRGATQALGQRYPLQVGICGVIQGSLPIGGLSSSAAVILAFLQALCDVNHLQLQPQELILTALAAENEYVGVNCGKLDQSCEVYCKKDHLLYLDTMDDSFELIPMHPQMKPYKIAIFFSGIQRSLPGSKFNVRVDECRGAAHALKAYAGMEYGNLSQTALRQVPYQVFLQYRDRLPENYAKRAEHFYTEFIRVQAGAEAWRRGDLESYGQLSFASGRSSIANYETGSEELIALCRIMEQTDGIYGGRFSGAGFKGCCMALIDPQKEDQILAEVGSAYLKQFPGLEGKYSSHICYSADGIISR